MAIPSFALAETIYEGRFLRMVRRGKWEYVERQGTSGVIAIVAVTDDQRLLLVEQVQQLLDKDGSTQMVEELHFLLQRLQQLIILLQPQQQHLLLLEE